ncbi:MAG: hypothetical protein GY756_05465 [bacterium]|nr:hypothetical protein [bacterium]
MISEKYLVKLRTIPINEVSFGYHTIYLYDEKTIPSLQIGYSVDQSGKTLIDNKSGSWQENWLVIGHDEMTGDPIFIDTSDDVFPVYTAIHGGDWEPSAISSSFDCFVSALFVINKYSKNRINPVELENNPIKDEEVKTALAEINDIIETDFWELIFEND